MIDFMSLMNKGLAWLHPEYRAATCHELNIGFGVNAEFINQNDT